MFAPLMRRECGLALEPNALSRLRREQVIRPDNPSFVGAVGLAVAIGQTLRIFPTRRLRLQVNSALCQKCPSRIESCLSLS